MKKIIQKEESFKKELTRFKRNVESLKEKYKDKQEIYKRLNHFDLRFRLALDTEVSFSQKYGSSTNTKDVKDTYTLLIKVCSLWNALDSFTLLFTNENSSVPSAIERQFEKEKSLEKNLLNIFLLLKNSVEKKAKVFETYENVLSSNGTKNQKNGIHVFFDSLKIGRPTNLFLIFRAIYAERNNYYHNGATAKFGIDYSSRKQILKIYQDFLQVFICDAANIWMEKELAKFN